VKLSVKSDYAARAVLGLARHFPSHVTLRMEDVAVEQGVPPKYLPQILLELKARGLVQSVRGKEGGYLLARPPGDITLGDVLRAVEGPLLEPAAPPSPDEPLELRRAWQKLQRALDAAADSITFQQLLEEGAEKEKMYYI
jgi:Rrf2 family transcriptional regulator, cysteine metabolism repressor